MLERALHINSVRATAGKNHVTTVEPEVTNTYKPDTPKGVKPVTDGTQVVDVCGHKGAVLETVSFPLPILGIECGSSATLRGYCIEPVLITSPKDLKPQNSSLWMMER